jgi:hypothetical protein
MVENTMKLSDFNQSPKRTAIKALNENYGIKFNVDNLNASKASLMLSEVKKIIAETKTSVNYRNSFDKSSLMKYVFMEQALTARLSEIRKMRSRFVIENVEVEKSRSVVAAQEMINSIQKMIEQVSDMVVKELPALSQSIEDDIDINKGKQFQQSANETLKALQQTLEQSRDAMSAALDAIASDGEAVADFDAMGGGEEEMGAGMEGGEEAEMPEEMPEMPEEEPEEPEQEEPSVGRMKR